MIKYMSDNMMKAIFLGKIINENYGLEQEGGDGL